MIFDIITIIILLINTIMLFKIYDIHRYFFGYLSKMTAALESMTEKEEDNATG